MHISDGVLPTMVTLGGLAASGGLLALSLRRLNQKDLPKVAVVTSAFFVASLVHLPFGPTSVHLMLPGLAGALLGPAAFLSITLGLFLQSMLFQFGGLTALGANALMMGLPALACGSLFQRLRGTTRKSHLLAGAVSGGLGILLAGLGLALLLASGGEDFLGVAKLALAAHVPAMLIEAAVTAATVGFLFRVKPEMLGKIRNPSEQSG